MELEYLEHKLRLEQIKLMIIIKQLEKIKNSLNNFESKMKKVISKSKKVVSNNNDDPKYIEGYNSDSENDSIFSIGISDDSDFDDYTFFN